MFKTRYSQVPTTDPESIDTPQPAIRRPKNLSHHYFSHVLLLLSNFLFIGLWLNANSSECVRPKLVYSPAKEAIRYEKRRLWRDIDNNVYAGKPRPEHDAAWRKLIEPITITISKGELSMINETSLALKDGSGYIAETAVYHELHCIKRIRRHLYLDYYYPDMTLDQRLREGPHIDHCLEYMREAAICRGDTTLSTFQWADGKPYSHVYSDHECVNWDRLDAWARGRMVDMSDYSILDV